MFAKKEKARLYSRKNPPGSTEDAEERLDELEEAQEQIISQLEFNELDDFVTDDAYDSWKRSAVAALAYCRAESRYLDQWLDKRASNLSNVTLLVNDAFETLQREVAGMAATMREQYGQEPLYTEACLPADVARAQARQAFLRRLNPAFQDLFKQINRKARNARLVPLEVSLLKKPLVEVFDRCNQEIGLLTGFILREFRKPVPVAA